MKSWKTAKASKSCNVFPSVWAAIVGCTGKGNAWRYGIGHFGRQCVEYACPTCRAATERLDALVGPAHQTALRALQDAAGVADYRLAEVIVVGGRPVLTGKVDAGCAYEAADEALRGFIAGDAPEHAAKALRMLCQAGAEAKALVASHRLSPRQRAALVAAYRAAV
jgi:hypothetical protein